METKKKNAYWTIPYTVKANGRDLDAGITFSGAGEL